MAMEVISPRIRGFVCTNAHPEGCAAAVRRQVGIARAARPAAPRGGTALVIGASTGYGLGSRIAAAIGHDMDTLGVFLERSPSGSKTGTAGWYNTVAFHDAADHAGRKAVSINADAFSNATRERALDRIRRELGPIDLLVYSLASPVRTHPETGQSFRSSLKPIGRAYTTKTLELEDSRVHEVTLEPATQEEIDATVAVMGGDDLRRWMDALARADLLAPGVRVTAYSYIGPQLTWPIYRDGTIGAAKNDVRRVVDELDAQLRKSHGGGAWVSMNAGVVTQASSAIPAVPLYISLLYQVMGDLGLKEEPIHQMVRLLNDHLAPGAIPAPDSDRLIRLDDRELRADVQARVAGMWREVTTENVRSLCDLDLVKREFQQLFGFAVEGVDYSKPAETESPIPV